MTTPRAALAAALTATYVEDHVMDEPNDDDLHDADIISTALASQGYAVTRSEAGLGRRQLMAAWKFYADQMPAYAVAAGLDRDQYAAVMVDVRHARAEYARLAADPEPSDVR